MVDYGVEVRRGPETVRAPFVVSPSTGSGQARRTMNGPVTLRQAQGERREQLRIYFRSNDVGGNRNGTVRLPRPPADGLAMTQGCDDE